MPYPFCLGKHETHQVLSSSSVLAEQWGQATRDLQLTALLSQRALRFPAEARPALQSELLLNYKHRSEGIFTLKI